MNAIVPVSHATPASTGLMPSNMDQAIRLADMMSTAKLVPTHLQGKPGDCLLVIEQAMRWGMSPFAVAQATSVIQGKLMFEGKLVSAAISASGILSVRLDYDFDGEGAARAVTAKATIRGEKAPRAIRCTLAEAKTTNQLWTKQPDQQLVYFATRAWARRHTPEVMLGVYAPEEFEAQTAPQFNGPTIDAAEAYARPAHSPAPAAPKTRTVREITRDHLVGCTTEDEVHAVGRMPIVERALTNAPVDVREEIGNMLAEALARVMADDGSAAHEPEGVG